MTFTPTMSGVRFSRADALTCLRQELLHSHAIEPAAVTPGASLQHDLGLDSLAVLDLLLVLLDASGQGRPGLVPVILTVRDACDFVCDEDMAATQCFLNLHVR